MARRSKVIRPDGLNYWVDERPPFQLTLLLAIQQLAFIGAIMTLPVVMARQVGLDAHDEANLVALTMITAGVGVILQSLNRFGIGIGLFSPLHTSSVAFPAALAAAKSGGLGLAFGMMSVAGLVQIAASRIMPWLRALFPVEIAGLTVLVLGLGLGMVGISSFFGLQTPIQDDPRTLYTGVLTLSLIIGISVWGRGRWHSFAVVLGLVAGQLFAVACGLVPEDRFRDLQGVDLFALPSIGLYGWSFDWRLLPNFIVVGVALSFNCFGVLAVVQRSNDAAWQRPDMQGIGRGLMAEGLTNIFGSLINGVTQTASGGAAGLALASGVTSRVVGFVLGALFIGLAFFPPVAGIWATLSPPVIGAVLMFVASFIIIGGIRILTLRLLDNRMTIVLGLALLAGIGHDMILANLSQETEHARVFLATTLSITVLLAVSLNALFRIGIARSETHVFRLDEQWVEEVDTFIVRLARRWNARREVVGRLSYAVNELHDVLVGHQLAPPGQEVTVTARFDEYRCLLRVTYQGEPLMLSDQRPDPASVLDDSKALQSMAGYLIRRLADRVKLDTSAGTCTVTLTFDD